MNEAHPSTQSTAKIMIVLKRFHSFMPATEYSVMEAKVNGHINRFSETDHSALIAELRNTAEAWRRSNHPDANRLVTLFTGQWADLPQREIVRKAAAMGYDGLELAVWGDHFDVNKAVSDQTYTPWVHALLAAHGLQVHAISTHLIGQAVCDIPDARHQAMLPPGIWGDGDPEGVRQRAAEEVKKTARAAKALGVKVVNGFTGSSIWHLLYSFPPNQKGQIEAGYADFANRWNPILDVFREYGIKFALEVHPTEIAFDIASAARALKAIGNRPEFGFNFDPSHLAYQNVDYVKFIRMFGDRIFHVHMKDVFVANTPTEVGTFGGHVEFGDPRRAWEFRSLGRGSVNFEEIIRALNDIGYAGPLSVEWEDGKMKREHGAAEAVRYVRAVDFPENRVAFDAAFDQAAQAPAKATDPAAPAAEAGTPAPEK